MADFGVGETVAAEGAKDAGEAVAAEGAADAGGAALAGDAAGGAALAGGAADAGLGAAAAGDAFLDPALGAAAGGAAGGAAAGGAAADAFLNPAVTATASDAAGAGAAGLAGDAFLNPAVTGSASDLSGIGGDAFLNPSAGVSAGNGAASAVPTTAGLPSPNAIPTGVSPGDAAALPDPTTTATQTGAATAPTYSGVGTPGAGAGTDAANVEGLNGAALNGVSAGPTGNASIDKALKALGATGDTALKYGPLALGTESLLAQKKAAGSAQQQFQQVAAPTQGVETQLLSNFSAGQLSGADSFAIAQYQQQQTAAVNAYYAKAGLSNSSMHTDALNQIQVKAEGMRQQALQNMLTQGLQAAGITDSTLTAGINAGLKQDSDTQTAMQNFINTLAKMNTGGSTTPAPAPAPAGTPG